MEIHFQQQQQPTKPLSKSKSKSKNAAVASNGGGASKFVGVRQRPSGRWVAEIKDTTHKIRMWLGTFETAEKAARAYDEAALLIRGANTRTNFSPPSPNRNSPLASRIRNLLRKKKITASPKQSTPVCGPTSSPVTTATSESSVVLQKDEDVYRPSFSNENNIDEFSWVFDSGIERLPLFDGTGDFELCNGVGGEEEMAEFDRMKVERQISASLYAINGVHEYLEAVRDASADPVWDLPPLCAQLYCTSNC